MYESLTEVITGEVIEVVITQQEILETLEPTHEILEVSGPQGPPGPMYMLWTSTNW